MKKIILLCGLLSGCAVYTPQPYMGVPQPYVNAYPSHSYYVPFSHEHRHEHHYQYFHNHWR